MMTTMACFDEDGASQAESSRCSQGSKGSSNGFYSGSDTGAPEGNGGSATVSRWRDAVAPAPPGGSATVSTWRNRCDSEMVDKALSSDFELVASPSDLLS